MIWNRLGTALVDRRKTLWALGGLAGMVLIACICAGYVHFLFLPIVVGLTLLFGMVETQNRLTPTSPWSGLDFLPGTFLGALSVSFFWENDPVWAGFVSLMGGLAGMIVWSALPTVPKMDEQRLRDLVDRLVLHAHAQGAPITKVSFHPFMTNRSQPLVTLVAKGHVTLYEEPRWARFRTMFVQPTVFPMRFTPELDAAFPDGVVWSMPTTAHARLSHVARVAASEANSVFGPSSVL